MKKIFMSPFLVPVGFVVLWCTFMAGIYYNYSANAIYDMLEEGGLVEIISHTGYVLLIGALLFVANDYKDRMTSWGIYLFLAICAFLREAGIQHHLSKTDTTPFKSRFFLNPNNPLGEKIIFGLILIVIAAAVVYLAVKYTKPLIKTFFKFDVVTWSIATMCTIGVAAKIVDRFPSNWRKAHGGEMLPENVMLIISVLEETSEMFLPFIAIIILAQYHLNKKEA